MFEVHCLVRNYAHPEGPKWEPKVGPLGEPVRLWTRREAEIVCNSIAASYQARATRIVEVKEA